MTAHTLPSAATPIDYLASLTPADLVAGPCALPQAPMAMPPQVIESEIGLMRRLFGSLLPHHPAAPSAGTGL